jgi:hypothetical protein
LKSSQFEDRGILASYCKQATVLLQRQGYTVGVPVATTESS